MFKKYCPLYMEVSSDQIKTLQKTHCFEVHYEAEKQQPLPPLAGNTQQSLVPKLHEWTRLRLKIPRQVQIPGLIPGLLLNSTRTRCPLAQSLWQNSTRAPGVNCPTRAMLGAEVCSSTIRELIVRAANSRGVISSACGQIYAHNTLMKEMTLASWRLL